jgi:hypothetical protein
MIPRLLGTSFSLLLATLVLPACADLSSFLGELSAATNPPGTGHSPAAASVTVNGKAFTDQDLLALGAQPSQVPPGDYWYDACAGLWGHVGSGAQGQIAPGLPLPPVASDVSRGDTEVVINGREITGREFALVQQVTGGAVAPGRYFLNANGDAGLEGGPVLVNLFPKQQQKATYIAHEGMFSKGGGFYDPATGDHYYSFTDSSGKTYSSGI